MREANWRVGHVSLLSGRGIGPCPQGLVMTPSGTACEDLGAKDEARFSQVPTFPTITTLVQNCPAPGLSFPTKERTRAGEI